MESPELSRHDELFQRLRESVLESPGTTHPELRRALESRVARASGRRGREHQPDAIPEVLRTYVDKLARHAYQITEDDLAALQRAGYSEDAIFELSIAAAIGAGAGRLERGLAALRGPG